MKKLSIFLIACFCVSFVSFSQQTIQKYKRKTYIFDSYEQATECNVLGRKIADTPTIVLSGSLFTIVRIVDSTYLVIKFLDWGKNDSAKRKAYNYHVDISTNKETTPKFFLLNKNIFDNACTEYIIQQKWDITLGSLTTPFKFRNDPFLYTSQLNLGTSLSFQKKFCSNWFWGGVAGLSLSSVTLDNFSTNGIVTSNTERPAVTPSLSGMIGYKNINLTFGVGWDLINKTSTLEQSWVYNGRNWIGIGFGISLFNEDKNANTKTTAQKQE